MHLKGYGARLRSLRTDRSMNQETLVQLLQEKYDIRTSQSYISHMENSGKVPSGEVVAGLARLLETSTDYLLLLTDDPSPSGRLTPLKWPESLEIVRAVEDLPQAKREEIRDVVEMMARHSRLASTRSTEGKPWPPLDAHDAT